MEPSSDVVTGYQPKMGADAFGGFTVAEAIHPRNFTCHLQPGDSLGDLAEAMVSSHRSAMGITDGDGKVVGMLTVNDIMRAYFEGTPTSRSLSDWLESGEARAPQSLLRRLVVPPSAPLAEVASKMVANAVAGDCACHHILVQDEEGMLHGVVSSHDLVEAFCHRDTWRQHPLFPDMFAPTDAREEVANALVRDVMKTRSRVFVCEPTETLKTVLKTLLVTRQNCLLVVDDDQGVYGLITTRDLVKAFADVIDLETTAAELVKMRPPEMEHKTISGDAKVLTAAELMATSEADHLIVTNAAGNEALGILSSLDLVVHSKARELVLPPPVWTGPTVSEMLKHHASHALCTKTTPLGRICSRLVDADQTAIIVEVSKQFESFGLLTENDIVRAFIAGHTANTQVGEILPGNECKHMTLPAYLQVTPTVHLTDAGVLMLSSTEPGRSCHHLAVRAVTGGWLGVFSALDVARALHSLTTKLEVAQAGMDSLPVEAIMKPSDVIPTCNPAEPIKDALSKLDVHGQNAVMVVDGGKVLGLITPRCALQAISKNVSCDISVQEWLNTRPQSEAPREILREATAKEAADLMTEHSLHHLLVVRDAGGQPVGVVSALDLVRCVVSTHQRCPFLTLAWLRHLGVPATFSPRSPATKRMADEVADGAPTAKTYRAEEGGA